MHTRITTYTSKLRLSVLVALALASCGGGTTGTSPTDNLKFSGYAEQSDGSRAGGLSMTVRSGATNQDLKESGTDPQGDFEMRLPESESSLVVDVVGVGATTVRRLQQGAGTLAAKLSAGQGGLGADLQFEVQVDTSDLCPILSAQGDELLVTSGDLVSSCPVSFSIASPRLLLGKFRGEVAGECNGVQTAVTSAKATQAGKLTLDLSDALARGCKDVRIVISTSQAAGLVSEFFVK